MKHVLLFSLVLFFGLTSCTIEKRLHTRGYHIDWHIDWKHKNKISLEKKETKELELAFKTKQLELPDIEHRNLVLDLQLTSNVNHEINPLKKNTITIKESKKKSALKQVYKDIKTGVKIMSALTETTPINANVKKTHGLAIAGFVIGIVGWFMPLEWAIAMLTIAIVFGLISLYTIKKNPEQYKGKGFAWAAYIIGLAGLLILILTM